MAEIPTLKLAAILEALGEARGYRDVRDVKIRAAAAPLQNSPEVGQALDRLDRVLANGKPLKTLVPRGYYFNVVV